MASTIELVVHKRHSKGVPMTANAIRQLLVAAAGCALITSTAVSSPLNGGGTAYTTQPTLRLAQGCFIDDGYGRRTSCDSYYREQQLVNRPMHPGCTVDDGYGRTSSCDAYFKERQAEEKKKEK
jgi:hypothetical protein